MNTRRPHNRTLALLFGLAVSSPLGVQAQAQARPASHEQAEVEFEADSDDVRFHVLTQETTGTVSGPVWSAKGSGHFFGHVNVETYEEICSAPCARRMVPNSYTFGLSHDGGRPIRAEGSLDIQGPSQVLGTYRSYAALRTAGVATMILSGIAGIAIGLSAANDCDPMDSDCDRYDETMGFGGVGILAGGMVIGMLMVFKGDEASVQIAPVQTARRPARAVAARDVLPAAQGALKLPILAGRF